MMNTRVRGGGLYECCACFAICSHNAKSDLRHTDSAFKEGDEADQGVG